MPSKKLKTYERAIDRTYNEYVRSTGLSQKDFEKILDEADRDFGDASGSVKQDELGAYLVDALAKGTITEEQAQAVWLSKWNKPSRKTFDDWRESYEPVEDRFEETVGMSIEESIQQAEAAAKPEATPEPTPTPEPNQETIATPEPTPEAKKTEIKKPEKKDEKTVTDLESFKKHVPIYSDNIETAYNLYQTEVKPLGISLEKYSQIVMDANTDGKNTATQDEMGNYLVKQVQAKNITQDQADAIWHTIWSKPKSKTFQKWLQENYTGIKG